MTTDYNSKIDRIYSAWCKKQGRTAGLALTFACALVPSVAFAQNTSADPDPDVEKGSYMSLTLNPSVVAVGTSLAGNATIYEGDGDQDSDDTITASLSGGGQSAPLRLALGQPLLRVPVATANPVKGR